MCAFRLAVLIPGFVTALTGGLLWLGFHSLELVSFLPWNKKQQFQEWLFSVRAHVSSRAKWRTRARSASYARSRARPPLWPPDSFCHTAAFHSVRCSFYLWSLFLNVPCAPASGSSAAVTTSPRGSRRARWSPRRSRWGRSFTRTRRRRCPSACTPCPMMDQWVSTSVDTWTAQYFHWTQHTWIQSETIITLVCGGVCNCSGTLLFLYFLI